MDLVNGDLTVQIVSAGARIGRIRYKGVDFLYPDTIVRGGQKDFYRGGMHICSPIFGEPQKGSIFFAAKRHGELMSSRWLGGKQGSFSNGAYSLWSHNYRRHGAELYYWLQYTALNVLCCSYYKNTFCVTTIVGNKSDFPVPVEVGWRPFFNAPFGATVEFAGDCREKIRIDGPFSLQYYNPCRRILIHLDKVGTVEMELEEEYYDSGNICIWTDWRRKYVCVIPLLSKPKKTGPVSGKYIYPEESINTGFTMSFSLC